MELSSQETSCASVLEDPAWWVASASPDHPRDDMGPSWDAAVEPPADKNALEGWPDESWDHNMKFFSLEISPSTKPLADSFFKKLWEILSSQSFESIWWGNDGNCIVIGEKLFRKMEEDSPLLTSMEELRAVAAAGSALGKQLFYSNPFFTRDDLPCVRRALQGAGESANPLAVPLPGTEILANLPRKRWDAQPAAGADEEEDARTSPNSGCTVPEARAGTAPRAGTAGPSPHKRPCRHGPARAPQAPPAPHGPRTLALPTLRSGQPNPGAAQGSGAEPPPPSHPWFGMAMLGPAAGCTPAHGHCPNCTCTASAAGPRHG